MILYYRRSE